MSIFHENFQPLCRCCEERLASSECPPDPDIGNVCLPCGGLLFGVEQGLKKIDGYGQCLPVGPDSGKGVLS